MDYRQRYAILNARKKEWLAVNPELKDESGIYFMTRYENNFKYAYVGQAKKVLTRLAEHLMGNQLWIDLSLKKHKLYSKGNQEGWQVSYLPCSESQLNEFERFWINEYANRGFQMRNKTIGGQDEGKVTLNAYNERKGYRKGVEFGYSKCKKEVKVYFDKYLDFLIKGQANKLKIRKFGEFKKFLSGEENEN